MFEMIKIHNKVWGVINLQFVQDSLWHKVYKSFFTFPRNFGFFWPVFHTSYIELLIDLLMLSYSLDTYIWAQNQYFIFNNQAVY